MQFHENINDDFLFIDDEEEDEVIASSLGETWKVLIVDDDPEIHSVTQLALSDLVVLGRQLEYLHAYSGEDSCKIIEENKDIVLILLDVVMETDHAGLGVVKHIRETLMRDDIRIVLRTGQPGYAPEESVIKNYDINDYKTKTELTRRKLVTTVYAAIRSYQQIDTVTKNREGLEKIVAASGNLLEMHNVHDFSTGVLTELNNIIDVKNSVFCARGQGIIANVSDLSLFIIGQYGFTDEYINKKLSILNDSKTESDILACFQDKKNNFYGESISLYLSSGGYRAIIHAELNNELSDIDKQLIEVFVTNISTSYENVHLFQKLSNAAYKDWLTNLPNRLEFINLLNDFSTSIDTNLVAMLIDINHFSDINDGLGQNVGNHLLQAVAERLSNINDSIIVARIDADVFGVIADKNLIEPNKILTLFTEPFSAMEQNIPLSASLGLCDKNSAGESGVKILNQINIALNLAKKSPNEPFVYYQKEMEDETLARLSMVRQLRTDFKDNRLELWYQPQLSVLSGKVIGAEALLRWKTTEGKFISPAIFIPLAEYSGLIIEIGAWVIEQACKALKTLSSKQYDVSISVNVSIPQFKRENFVDNVIEIVEKNQVVPQKLELEITENVLMDEPQVIIDALTQLRNSGIKVALDDFGTGFSSLSYLQNLPLDRLKVDRSFVTNIAEPSGAILADTIINLGKQMDLKVIAEGIETIEQEQQLKALGCDEVQGFYYAKPMTADSFLEFLEKNNS